MRKAIEEYASWPRWIRLGILFTVYAIFKMLQVFDVLGLTPVLAVGIVLGMVSVFAVYGDELL